MFEKVFLENTPTPTLTTDQYYSELSDYLGQFGMSLSENKINPDIGYVDESQKGIYKGKDQIGKIELEVNGDTLILKHIKSYSNHYNKQKFGLVNKIYPFHRQMALLHNLTVKIHPVNNITNNKFLQIFKDFQIKKSGENIFAIPKHG